MGSLGGEMYKELKSRVNERDDSWCASPRQQPGQVSLVLAKGMPG